jgi:hypothetical protein
VTWCLKGKIVEPEETAVAREMLGKHISAAMNTHVTTEELWEAVCPKAIYWETKPTASSEEDRPVWVWGCETAASRWRHDHEGRGVPIVVNHCVTMPSEDTEDLAHATINYTECVWICHSTIINCNHEL